MNDGKKTYAIISGIVALLLVLALAFTVLMAPKATPNTMKQAAGTTSVKKAAIKRGSSTNTVKAVVRTPDMNQVRQSVTVKR